MEKDASQIPIIMKTYTKKLAYLGHCTIVLTALTFNLWPTQRARGAAFNPTGSLTPERDHHTATLLANGSVLAVGGDSSGGVKPAGTQLYDPIAHAWTSTGNTSLDRTLALRMELCI